MEALQEQHAAYYGNVVINRIGPNLYNAEATSWLIWLEQEHDNIRATLAWSLATEQGVARGAQMVNVLFWFWYRRGYTIESRLWANRILESPFIQAPSAIRAMTLFASGSSAMWQGNQDIALPKVMEGVAIGQKLDSIEGVPFNIMRKASRCYALLVTEAMWHASCITWDISHSMKKNLNWLNHNSEKA